jgi:hypothetical protein
MLYDETENPVDFVKVVEGPAADLLYPDSR